MIARLVTCGALLAAVACLTKPEHIGATSDAPIDDTCREPACDAAGGTCFADGFCHIITNEKGAQPRCPDGMRCDVECVGDDACEMGVKCGRATSCRVRCDSGMGGDNVCTKGSVDCGEATTCTVECDGANACKDKAIECRASTCDVTCDGDNACAAGVRSDAACSLHCCNGACDTGMLDCPRGPSC